MRRKRSWFFTGVIAAVVTVAITGCSSGAESKEIQENTVGTTEAGIEIRTGDISTSASYYDMTVDGTDVEIFAVLASDGTVRLAMNTCQVCNGSPYAYFEQDGNDFVCQNCGNRFSSDQIGLTGGGCNPVPITDDDYSEASGTITVSEAFLEKNAYRFSNWKQF